VLNTSSKTQFNCSICNKPVDLLTAKTDDKGKAVHAECYVMVMMAKQPAPAATI
jgi:hypothetical protein